MSKAYKILEKLSRLLEGLQVNPPRQMSVIKGNTQQRQQYVKQKEREIQKSRDPYMIKKARMQQIRTDVLGGQK